MGVGVRGGCKGALTVVTEASIPISIEQLYFDQFGFQLGMGFYCYKHLKISNLVQPNI